MKKNIRLFIFGAGFLFFEICAETAVFFDAAVVIDETVKCKNDLSSKKISWAQYAELVCPNLIICGQDIEPEAFPILGINPGDVLMSLAKWAYKNGAGIVFSTSVVRYLLIRRIFMQIQSHRDIDDTPLPIYRSCKSSFETAHQLSAFRLPSIFVPDGGIPKIALRGSLSSWQGLKQDVERFYPYLYAIGAYKFIGRLQEIFLHVLALLHECESDIDFWQEVYRYDYEQKFAAGWLVFLCGGQHLLPDERPLPVDEAECISQQSRSLKQLFGILGCVSHGEDWYEPVIGRLLLQKKRF